jgi:hypothetical protein
VPVPSIFDTAETDLGPHDDVWSTRSHLVVTTRTPVGLHRSGTGDPPDHIGAVRVFLDVSRTGYPHVAWQIDRPTAVTAWHPLSVAARSWSPPPVRTTSGADRRAGRAATCPGPLPWHQAGR